MLAKLNALFNPAWTAGISRLLEQHVTPGSKHYVVVFGVLGALRILTTSVPFIFGVAVALVLFYGVKEAVEIAQGDERVRSVFDFLWALAGALMASRFFGL